MPVTLAPIALALLLAPPVARLTVDVPLVLAASGPASGVETVLEPWGVVRVGKLWDVSGDGAPALGFGGDLALWAGGFESEGTAEVSATRAFAAVEARGVFAWTAFSTTNSALAPFVFLGTRVGGGLSSIKVFDDSRVGFLPYWGGRAGLGLDWVVHHGLVRTELGAGIRDGRFELTSGVSLGGVF